MEVIRVEFTMEGCKEKGMGKIVCPFACETRVDPCALAVCVCSLIWVC